LGYGQVKEILRKLGNIRLAAHYGALGHMRVRQMASELRRAQPIYYPSKFWQDLNQVNTAQLRSEGFRNFKRTLNQNYFNWGPNSLRDNQIRNLLRRWNEEPEMTPLLATLEGDHRLLNMFNQDMLDSPEKARTYAFFVGLLWWLASKNDSENLTGTLEEPTLGNPLRIRLGGRLISQDLANSIREYNVIQEFRRTDPKKRFRVAEIGAGYGRLAYVFLSASSCQYLIFDVPPALYVSERYLTAALPQKKVFQFRSFDSFELIEEELRAADVAFFTPNQLALLPPAYVDVSVSISALHEMRREQIDNFLSLMGNITKEVVYLKNWSRWHNDSDGVTIDDTTFVLPRPWKVMLERTDLVQDLFTEKLFVRPQ
jgi:putative sugar O-methyltransferase